MQYRRFGRTERRLSAITLGGMRYKTGWSQPREEVPAEMLEECRDITRMALAAGITHIETAQGYGRSEYCYGKVLNQELRVPRHQYHLMTKGGARTADEVRRMVDEQLKGLQTDHIDLYGWHGINTAETLREISKPGGAVAELHKLREEGVIGAVGFSTHAPLEVIIDALATDLFSFVNLHYYYFFQRNAAAVAYAHAKDIGVFIISPNDKGGQLFNPSSTLRELCAPLTPIQFNARWCLQSPLVQTLSFGLTAPAHVSEMNGIFPAAIPLDVPTRAILHRLDARQAIDPISAWEGFEYAGDASGINIPEVLRFRRMWKCYDMKDFGLYRYNMLQAKGDWFPGVFATPEAVAKVDPAKAPPGINVQALLSEAHEAFYRAP
jgi:predicted aldo/keto reductase-like oxidoreductase